MTDRSAALETMLNPRSVAHIGASESGVYPSGIFTSLAASDVEVFPVNPNRDSVFGHACFKSVGDLPNVPDLAIITVDRRYVKSVLADCVAAGVPAAVIITSGFAEAGEEGSAFQKELESFAGKILILGPNCAGFANIPKRITATRLAGTCGSGGISFVSQSGALMMALHGSFAARGAGMRYLVSVGNQVDITAEDLLASFAADPGTTVAVAFMESIKDGRAFIHALELNLAAGKPVVLIKAGRTDAGIKLAATHTAAAAGGARVFEAVCRQYGAILVDDIDDMVSVSLLADSRGAASSRRIAWITQSGGLGSLTGDHATMAGIEPPPFPETLCSRLRDHDMLPGYQPILNPVDLRGDSMRGSVIRDSMLPFIESDEIDCIGLLFAKSPRRPVETDTARAIIAVRNESGKPVVVVWVGNTAASCADGSSGVSAIDLLVSAGIPVFFQPGDAIRAIARLIHYCEFRRSFLAGQRGGHAFLS
ncbi:MAG: CoA-binding protein [Spirochaetes bacterium]|nr:CoA-binding protein [Spirochaetota bacterium]